MRKASSGQPTLIRINAEMSRHVLASILGFNLHFDKLVVGMLLDKTTDKFRVPTPPFRKMLGCLPIQPRQYFVAIAQPFDNGRIEPLPVRQTINPLVHRPKGQYEGSVGVLLTQYIQRLYLWEEATYKLLALNAQFNLTHVFANAKVTFRHGRRPGLP